MIGSRGVVVGASAGAALGTLLAVAVTVLPAPSAAPSTKTPAAVGLSTPGTNRDRTIAMTRHLVTTVPLPPGARPRSNLASSPGPVMGTPASDNKIDSPRAWDLPLSFDAARAWFIAHPPPGLTASGEATFSGQWGTGYPGPEGLAWDEAQIQVTVSQTGPGTSTVRVDGIALSWDPRPTRDTTTGLRLRITVTGGCPRFDAGGYDVSNSGIGLNDALAPSGTVTGGLICRYVGMNPQGHVPADGLISSIRLDATAAAAEQRTLRAVRVGTDAGTRVCPADLNMAQFIVLSYRGRADVDVVHKLTGCGGYSNGVIIAG